MVKKRKKLSGKINISQRKWTALDQYYIDNKWDLNLLINKCYSCGETYLGHNFAHVGLKHSKGRRGYSFQCRGCEKLRLNNMRKKLPVPTKKEYLLHSQEYWLKVQKEYVEKYTNKPRRIPKELKKNRHYKKTKELLKDMTPLEEKELITQIKENYSEKLIKIEALGLPIIRKDNQALVFLTGDLDKVARQINKYVKTTKADPSLRDLPIAKRKLERAEKEHITKYGIATAVGVTVEQLDKILEAEVELTDELLIQAMLRGVVELHNDYVAKLTLDNNAGSIKYLEKFGDKTNWGGQGDGAGDSIVIEKGLMEDVLNHLMTNKLEEVKKEEQIPQFIDIENNEEEIVEEVVEEIIKEQKKKTHKF